MQCLSSVSQCAVAAVCVCTVCGPAKIRDSIRIRIGRFRKWRADSKFSIKSSYHKPRLLLSKKTSKPLRRCNWDLFYVCDFMIYVVRAYVQYCLRNHENPHISVRLLIHFIRFYHSFYVRRCWALAEERHSKWCDDDDDDGNRHWTRKWLRLERKISDSQVPSLSVCVCLRCVCG